MTLEIGLVLGILFAALVLFVTEWVRMDVVALFVLGAVALTGLVTPTEALAGFSNPAVVTVWAMFMISAALSRTGVADIIGRQVLRMAGSGEVRLIVVVMLTAGILSAFMNNIGVAALMLPVVMEVARKTGRPPSRLLMPLAYGSLLGGLTTLIGTPPNLLVSAALSEHGLEPFALFDFAPVGGAILLVGVVFVAFAARFVLPSGSPARPEGSEQANLPRQYGLHERAVVLRIEADSPLIGRTLGESRIGSAADLNVMAITRGSKTLALPPASQRLEALDRLLVGGKLDRFHELQGWRGLVIEEDDLDFPAFVDENVGISELILAPQSELTGKTIRQADLQRRMGLLILAVRRESTLQHSNLATATLQAGDRLLALGERERFESLSHGDDFSQIVSISLEQLHRDFDLRGRLFEVRIVEGSILHGKSLAESRLGDALRLGVMGIVRDGARNLRPSPDERLAAGDRLLVRGERDDLEVLQGLQQLTVESEDPHRIEGLESEQIGFVEAVLSPHTTLAGKTLRDLQFRERYGVQALALMREGLPRHTQVRDTPLRFGDALLLLGRRERLVLMSHDPEFLVLSSAIQQAPKTDRALLAVAILAAVLTPVLLGWISIAIAAVVGAALMVVTRCISMEEAYRAIEWRSIFLIAGVLPLGVAMHQTGAANFVAEQVLGIAGSWGPWGILAAVYLITAAATMIIPTAALVVLMAPIALRAAAETDLSPYALMMAVAMAASASFTSPISHPANVLVMGPGGYRFADYLKLGVPLTLVIFAVVMLVLPLIWPL